MYRIECRWAGYLIREQPASQLSDVEEVIRAIKEAFISGLTHHIYGSEMKIKVLCIDVFHEGRLILQTDFKT